MGKVTGAALKIAAPEAAVAAKAAGGASKARGSLAGEKDPGKVRDELARRRHDAAASSAARKAAPAHPNRPTDPPAEDATDGDQADDTDTDQGDQGGATAGPFGGMTVPATGSGFLLGLMTWALVRAYIGNGGTSGVAGVKALLMAKFLNKNPDGTYMARQAPAAASTSGGGQ